MKAPRSPFARSSTTVAIAAFGLALLQVAMPQNVRAETIASGTVVDAVTGDAIAGAKVSIRGAGVSSDGLSDSSGIFTVAFRPASSTSSKSFTLTVEQDGYTAPPTSVVVTSGRTERTAYPIQLLPTVLVPCMRKRDHAVVVGHFRPPTTGPAIQVDLASQVAEALRLGLLPSIQQQHLDQGAQPLILACDEAKPRAAEDSPGYARALGADAFLSGFVSPSGSKFKVDMTVGNRYDATAVPVHSSSRDVDLNDLAAAHLDSKAYEAVLQALVAGYEDKSPAECVEVVGAAERILHPLPPAFADARSRCQQKLPNRGLLKGTTP